MNKLTKTMLGIMIVGVVFIIATAAKSYSVWTKTPEDIETKAVSAYNVGDLADGNVQYVIDEVATLETYDKTLGIKHNKKNTPFYLIEVQDGYVIYQSRNDSKNKTLAAMSDDTYEYFTYLENVSNNVEVTSVPALPQKFAVTTYAEEMPDDLREIVYDYFLEAGYSNAECDQLVANCVLKDINYKNTQYIPLIGIAMIIFPLLIIIIVKINQRSKFKKWQQNQMNNEPYNM